MHTYSMDLDRIFGTFDVLLSLSLEESFGLTVIEAMSRGLPCVLSDIPAFRAFEGVRGVRVVDPDSPDDVARALDSSFEISAEDREAIRQHWQDRYSVEAVVEQWECVIGSIVHPTVPGLLQRKHVHGVPKVVPPA